MLVNNCANGGNAKAASVFGTSWTPCTPRPSLRLRDTDGDFSRKSQKFSHTLVFCAPAEGVPLELGIGAGGQKN